MAPVSTSEKSPPKTAYDEAVQIKIGPASAAKIFTIHKGILIFYSGYFEGALRHSSTFKEARDGVFWLPDEDIATWERFMVFLYREEIDLTGIPFPPLDVLCRLWVLADRREVPLLMNKCIDAIKDEVFAKWHRPVDLLPYIYANTAPGSALRRLVLLLVARVGDDTAMVSPFHPATSCYFNEESLRELFELVWSLNDDRLWDQGIMLSYKTCPKYHSHGPGEQERCREED